MNQESSDQRIRFKPYERIPARSRTSTLVLTCEHAGRVLPPGIELGSGDERWLDTHWGWDPGAAVITRSLARQFGAPAILANFSRLVCDSNRDIVDTNWIRREIEGEELVFNREVDEDERRRRLKTCYEPYHLAIDHLLSVRGGRSGETLLLSIHTFTPKLGEELRTMEIGVLFDARYKAVAKRLESHLVGEGFVTALNQPYSGLDGMIFSVWRHGSAHGIVYLEVEIRQDLLEDPSEAEAIATRLGKALTQLKLRARIRD